MKLLLVVILAKFSLVIFADNPDFAIFKNQVLEFNQIVKNDFKDFKFEANYLCSTYQEFISEDDEIFSLINISKNEDGTFDFLQSAGNSEGLRLENLPSDNNDNPIYRNPIGKRSISFLFFRAEGDKLMIKSSIVGRPKRYKELPLNQYYKYLDNNNIARTAETEFITVCNFNNYPSDNDYDLIENL